MSTSISPQTIYTQNPNCMPLESLFMDCPQAKAVGAEIIKSGIGVADLCSRVTQGMLKETFPRDKIAQNNRFAQQLIKLKLQTSTSNEAFANYNSTLYNKLIDTCSGIFRAATGLVFTQQASIDCKQPPTRMDRDEYLLCEGLTNFHAELKLKELQENCQEQLNPKKALLALNITQSIQNYLTAAFNHQIDQSYDTNHALKVYDQNYGNNYCNQNYNFNYCESGQYNNTLTPAAKNYTDFKERILPLMTSRLPSAIVNVIEAAPAQANNEEL